MRHARELTTNGGLTLSDPVAAPAPAVRSSSSPPAAAGFAFEIVPGAAMAALETPWADLAARALEPNPFFEPEFALPAVTHLYGARKPSFALVWQTAADGSRTRLAALLPLQPSRGLGFARAAVHRYAASGIPLVDRNEAAAAVDHLLAGLRAALPRAAGLILPQLPAEGAFFALLQARAAAAGEVLPLLESYERAALRETAKDSTRPASPKHRKNLRRQRRRLEDAGALTYRTVGDPAAVRATTDRFLELEAQGWKGRRGTALLSTLPTARFVRAMTERLAAVGRCRIDSFEVDGRAVAMGVVLGSGDRAYFWKTAYDEAYATRSPGVQLTLELTRTQLGRSGVNITDSCATAEHPMINGLWPDRLRIATVAVPLRPGTGLALQAERLVRAARRLAKRAIAARNRRRRPVRTQ